MGLTSRQTPPLIDNNRLLLSRNSQGLKLILFGAVPNNRECAEVATCCCFESSSRWYVFVHVTSHTNNKLQLVTKVVWWYVKRFATFLHWKERDSPSDMMRPHNWSKIVKSQNLARFHSFDPIRFIIFAVRKERTLLAPAN